MIIGILFLSTLTILSSILVIFFSVTPVPSWLVLILSLIITMTVILDPIEDPENKNKQKKNSFGFLFGFLDSRFRGNDKLYYLRVLLRVTCYVFVVIVIFLFYSRYQSTGSSPLVWNILPGWFLPVLLVLFVIYTLFALSRKTKKQKNPSSQTPIWDPNNKQQTTKKSFGFFFSFLDSRFRGNDGWVAYLFFPIIFLTLPVLFPIGTDYDPFVHRAAETTIVEHGSISPRTFLYSGEYGLVSVISTVTRIPVKTVNIWLLPILCILFLPWLFKKAFKHPLAPLILFLLPLSLLTTTVPQGLGIFFLLLLLLLFWRNEEGVEKFSSEAMFEEGLASGSIKDLRESEPSRFAEGFAETNPSCRGKNFSHPFVLLYFFLAFASFLSHPFPGIAAFIFLGFAMLPRILSHLTFKIKDLKLLLSTFYFLLSTLILPLALYFNNYLPSQFSISSISLNTGAFATLKGIFNFGWIRYTDPLSFVYFFGKNYYLFFFLLVIIGIIHKITKSQKTQNQNNDVIAPVRHSFNEDGSEAKQSPTVIPESYSGQALNPIQVPKNKNQKQKEPSQQWSNETMKPLNPYSSYLLSFLSTAISSLLVLFFLHPNVTSPEHTQLFTRVFSISLVFLWPLFLSHVTHIIEHVSQKQEIKKSRNHNNVIASLTKQSLNVIPAFEPESKRQKQTKKNSFDFFFSFLDSRFRGNDNSGYVLCVMCYVFFAALIVSNIYLQFPHSDRLEAHKGFLVSQDDITTVQKIESFAQKPYLVLANQTIGAAALDQFGFANYVNQQSTVNSQQNKNVIAPVRSSVNEGGSEGKQSSIVIPDSIGNPENKNKKQKDSNKQWSNETIEQYFYSIPISSIAQAYYLQMLKNPSQKLVDEIFQTYEIQELYLILNDYWKNSRIISKNLSKVANQTLTVGENTVFRFLPSRTE